ncbi:MAG: hypothetical protein UT29_C0001G0157 [Candidatus Yanofskybacteria bacterium GW2011_GWA1_39_13]|uniref:Uncharacterized protein n=1 Tax=Yanofskybacteria sp. (strain GW2011_GWA1_39_13) TaxID=1619019 RepID=A0A0G0QLX9_YANXG|nr:MAG: hypothetical protein UT29_C0001G0157 [Candidatus Yanofskybacteria bacterium GW2011_GWA1_39_13]
MTHEEDVQDWNNFTNKIRENPWIILMLIFSLVYFTSEICQQLLVGPRWLRWYAGAIGFSSNWALLSSILFGARAIRCLFIGFGIQMLWEIGQYPAHFDFHDAFIGTVGTAVILLLAYNYKTRSFSSLAVSQLL